MKIARGGLAVAAMLAALSGCVSMEQQYQSRVDRSIDRQLYSTFYPSPAFGKAGYDTQVYDDYIRITQQMATASVIGEAERKYLSLTSGADPVLDTYLSVAAKRGGKVKAYKGSIHETEEIVR